MNIRSAREGKFGVHIRVDGCYVIIPPQKYTILEIGYAVLLAGNDECHGWLEEISEIIPPDPEDNRAALRGGAGSAITSNSVLVSLAYNDWWAQNEGTKRPGRALRIIPLNEADRLVRNRRILNDFNLKYAGKLAGDS